MKILEYRPQLDKKLKITLQIIFRKNLAVKMINKSEVNFAYKVASIDGVPFCHARISRQKKHPSFKKLLWISNKLKERRIPQAKILYSGKSSRDFPNGFMVSEWIEGINGWQSIEDGIYSTRSFAKETAKVISRVHAIKISNLGYYNKYQKEISEIPKNKKFKWLFKKNIIEKKYVENIVNLLLRVISKVPMPEQSTLVHLDLNPDNIIVKNDKSFVLVDWDDAKEGWWMQDCAYITYWSNNPKETRAGFFDGYGKVDMSDKEIKVAELVEWILQSLKFLPYYKFYFIDEKKYKERLTRLQKDFAILKSII